MLASSVVQRRRGTAGLGMATLGLGMLALTACSSSGDRADRPTTHIELPAKNVDRWVMPLDEYIPVDDHVDDYAEALLVQPCMEAKGYSWDVPWQDVNQEAAVTRNAVDRRIFTAEVARVHGYRDLGGNNSPDDAWRAFALSDIPDEEFDASRMCLEAARKVMPLQSGSAQLATSYAQSAYEAAQESKAVRAKAKLWRKCMEPAGISDLPDTPAKMPTDSMMSEFGINAGPTPTADEIELAVRDAGCRNESGWTKAAYNAEWKLQVAELAKNADELQAIRGETVRHRALVSKVIAEHAPKAPSVG
ncbi:hypothetical protein ACFOYW_14620 [Gryllotalpicola reticulitermitis]|uniref:Uncharacterized protein n=1 Tax=Gryllotalpicola reticulitermitis TaxID=1184153 RepID=A0ABV8Q8C4_9MICO